MRFFPLLLLALPLPLHAQGLGTTYAVGQELASSGSYVSPFWAPSLDVHLDNMVIQAHALELLAGLTTDELLLGGDLYVDAYSEGLPGGWTGVLRPGGSLDIVADLDFSPFTLTAAGLLAMGLESGERFHVGAYVVPALGLGVVREEFEFIYGGTLQFSVWMDR